jgi:hypothetical protein
MSIAGRLYVLQLVRELVSRHCDRFSLAALDVGRGGHHRRPRPQLGHFAGQIAQRRGPKIARVALARRLLTLCSQALCDKGGCRAYPVAGGLVTARWVGVMALWVQRPPA